LHTGNIIKVFLKIYFIILIERQIINFKRSKSKMKYDIESEMFRLQNNVLLYRLAYGLTYTEMANKYYFHNKNKLIYEVRKLLKTLHLKNRRQLVFFALSNGLIDIDIQEDK